MSSTDCISFVEKTSCRVTSNKQLTSCTGEKLEAGFFQSSDKYSFYLKNHDTMAVVGGFNDLKQAGQCINQRINQPDWKDRTKQEVAQNLSLRMLRREKALLGNADQEKNTARCLH